MNRITNKSARISPVVPVACENACEKRADCSPQAAPSSQNGPPSGTLPLPRCRWCDVALPTGQNFCSTCCSRCGTKYQPGDSVCPSCRSFLPRNQAARVLGLRSRIVPEDLRMDANELMDGIVADLGGRENLTTLEASYIRKIADVEITIRLLASSIATEGMFTSGNRVRDVYDRFLSGLDRFDRLAQRVGLQRRAKQIDPVEAVRQAVVRANAEPDGVTE